MGQNGSAYGNFFDDHVTESQYAMSSGTSLKINVVPEDIIYYYVLVSKMKKISAKKGVVRP